MRKNLILTTAVTTSLLGYYRRAYSACSGTNGIYICSGSETSTQIISASGAEVSTVEGFSINASSGSGLLIYGYGDLSFSDADGPAIISANNATGFAGLSVQSYDYNLNIDLNGTINVAGENSNSSSTGISFGNTSGSSILNISGDIYANSAGIFSLGNSNSSITTSSNSVINVSGENSSSNSRGIRSQNFGSGSNILNIKGDINANKTGIIANNSNTSLGNISVTMYADSTINVSGGNSNSNSEGIESANSGTGFSIFDIRGDINANKTGVRASIIQYGSGFSERNLSITTSVDSKIDVNGENSSNTSTGISAINYTSGLTTLNISGDIDARNNGIYALNFSTSAVSITTNSASEINSDNMGIFIAHRGNGLNTLNLSGDITTESGSAIYIGLDSYSEDYTLYSENSVNITIQNGANISGNKAVSSQGGDFNSTNFNVTLDGSVEEVSVTGTSGTAIEFHSDILNDSITIKGNVTINGDVDLGGGIDDEITFENANLTLADGSSFSNFESTVFSGENILNGDFDFRGIDVTNNATSLKINGTFAIDNFEVNSGSTLSGNSTIDLSGAGSLIVNSGGNAAPGNSIGTINVIGDVIFRSGSNFNVEIDATSADKIIATGSVTIDAGTNLNITAINGATAGSGTILESGTGISGTFSNLVSVNGESVSLVYTNDLNLSFIAVNSSAFNSQIQSSVNNSILFSDTLTNQIALNAFEKGNNFYFRSVNRNQNSTANSSEFAFSNNAHGLVFGAEKEINSSYKLGFSLSQINDNMSMKGDIGSRKNESTFASIYGNYHRDLSNSKFFTSLAFGFGYHDGKSKRLVNNDGAKSYANSISNDIDINLTLQTGLKHNLEKDFYIMPYLSASYIHSFAGGFRETAGGNSAVEVNDYNFATIKYRESIRFGSDNQSALPYQITKFLPQYIKNISFSPYFDLGLSQERAIGKRKVSGSFNASGDKFSTTLNNHDRNFLTTAIGIKTQIAKDISGFLSYDRSKSNQETRDEINLGVGVKF